MPALRQYSRDFSAAGGPTLGASPTGAVLGRPSAHDPSCRRATRADRSCVRYRVDFSRDQVGISPRVASLRGLEVGIVKRPRHRQRVTLAELEAREKQGALGRPLLGHKPSSLRVAEDVRFWAESRREGRALGTSALSRFRTRAIHLASDDTRWHDRGPVAQSPRPQPRHQIRSMADGHRHTANGNPRSTTLF